MPIWANGQIVGLLIPTFPPRGAAPRPPANDYIARINQDLLVGALGAVALSLLLGLFFSSTLTRPLKELIDATRDVAQGNLEREVPVRSKDELGELTKSFNKMSAQLKQSRDLRRNMTADIAHELRTPLSIILGHTEALSENKLDPSPETFDIIYDEAKRLSLLIEDLRTLSLSEAGELTLTLQPVSPSDLIDRVSGAYLPKAAPSIFLWKPKRMQISPISTLISIASPKYLQTCWITLCDIRPRADNSNYRLNLCWKE